VFAFRADGTPLLLSGVENDVTTLVLIDLVKESELRRFHSPGKALPLIAALSIASDGSRIAALCRAIPKQAGGEANDAETEPDTHGLVAVWDAASGALVRSIDHAMPATDLTLSPDGRYAAVGDAGGNVAVWTVPDGNLHARLPASDNRIACQAFGRDPHVSYREKPDTPRWQLAVGDSGGIVTILDLQTRRIRNICRGSNDDIKALGFSSGGSRPRPARGRSARSGWNRHAGDR